MYLRSYNDIRVRLEGIGDIMFSWISGILVFFREQMQKLFWFPNTQKLMSSAVKWEQHFK